MKIEHKIKMCREREKETVKKEPRGRRGPGCLCGLWKKCLYNHRHRQIKNSQEKWAKSVHRRPRQLWEKVFRAAVGRKLASGQ